MNKLLYPAIISKGETCAYVVRFADFTEMTQGDNLAEVAKMAKECLELVIEGRIEDKEEIPNPTLPECISLQKDEFIMLIEVNVSLAENYVKNRSVKKTVTLPYWLNERAEGAKVNFSQLLQIAIKEHLNLY